MFNLLPEDLKKKIKSEYKTRKIVVILFFVLCLQFSFLVFLFPSWLISLYNEKEVVAQSEEMNKYLSDLNIIPTIDLIKSINKKLNSINNSLEYSQIIPFINIILSKKTSSIKINEFSYSISDPTTVELTVGGISSTRESLVSFAKSLEESKSFAEVNLPISNLAKDKNIKFSISMKVINQ